MAQQMDEEEKQQRADYCILNDGTTDLEEQIDHILNQLNNKYTK
jgi:dephospho-CoA kinase